MGELGNKLKALVIGLAIVSCIVPVPAYASTVEDWATLNGWLSSINGNIQLCYAELTNIYTKLNNLNASNWTNTRVVDLLGKMAHVVDYTSATSDYLDGINSSVSNIELSTGENGNLDISLDGIAEATSGTALLVDSLLDEVQLIKTNTGTHISNFNAEAEWFNEQFDYLLEYVEGNNAYLGTLKGILDNNTTNNQGIKQVLRNTKTTVDDLLTAWNAWKDTGYSVATTLTVPSLTTIENKLQNLISRWDDWKNAGYTVDTGLTIPSHPSLTAITNAVNACKTDLESLLAAWNAWKNSGYTVDTGLTIPSHPSLTAITNAVNACKTDLDAILAAWNAWKNAGYTVDTGLTIPSHPSLTAITNAVNACKTDLDAILAAWNAWKNAGYTVDTGLTIPGIQNLQTGIDGVNTKLQSVINFLQYWDDLNFPVTVQNPVNSFNDSNIIQAINGLKGSVDAIHSWLLLGTVADIVGNFDFSSLAEKSSQLLDDASDIAPFAGFALIAAMLEIWAGSGALSDPSLQFNFDFFQPGNTVTLDLSWINDGLPLVHFLMISMLILCVVNCSARIIELEATS